MRPRMELYEKNHSIIQQLPKSAKIALASVDYTQSETIVKTLTNLDILFIESRKNYENKSNMNNSDQIQAQVGQLNTFNNRGRGRFNNNRGHHNNRQFHSRNNDQSHNEISNNFSIPDTSVPPPNMTDQACNSNQRNSNCDLN